MPSLRANVPAKITINSPKAIKINCSDVSIINEYLNYLGVSQWLSIQELQTFFFNKNYKLTDSLIFWDKNNIFTHKRKILYISWTNFNLFQ